MTLAAKFLQAVNESQKKTNNRFKLPKFKSNLINESKGEIIMKRTDKEPIQLTTHLQLVEEMWDSSGGKGPETPMTSCRTNEGHYVGNEDIGNYFKSKLPNIKPELASPDDDCCSIGYDSDSNKWYGWSHRAMVGFGVGDKIFEEEYGDDNTLFTSHGKKDIKTMDDARLSATRFASYVS